MARLGDICIINPKAPVLADDLEVSFVPMPKVGEQGEFDPSEIKEYREVKKGFTNFQNGDVLFAKITPCMENGKGAVAKDLKNGYGFGSTEFHVLRPDYSKVTSEWLYYLTSWNAFRKDAEINMTGSAGQKRVPKTFLEKYEVNLPEVEKQNEMADTLEYIGKLIALRKEQLAKLDELVKSRFVELFGDPRINPKGYDIVPISSLFDVGSSKRVFESEWREVGVPFYRAREIVKLSRDGHVDNELFIEESMYEAYKEKYGVPKAGDMMVTGVGTLGVCYIVKETDRFYFKDGNTLWFKNKGLCDVRFIKDQYDTDFVKEQITANANVSTVGTYTITNANNTLVLIPPLEEQEQYVEFCKQTDKSKLAIQESLAELETLKKALMQKYFG